MLRHYDPDKYSITFGSDRITGWADGEFFTAEMKSKVFESVVGTGGDVALSKLMDKRCTVILKVLQTSPINAVLSEILQDAIDGESSSGIKPLQIKDNTTEASSDKALVYGKEACIMGWPNLSRDRTAKMNEWEIEIAECERFEGGA